MFQFSFSGKTHLKIIHGTEYRTVNGNNQLFGERPDNTMHDKDDQSSDFFVNG